MAHLQWDAGHLLGRLGGLRYDHKHLKALFDICYMQSRVLFEGDGADENEITMVGLFRLGHFLLERLETNIKEVQAIADAGLREARPAVKGGE